MKAFYDNQPSELQQDNDGTFLFRWNIESFENEDEQTMWICDEIRCTGEPSKHHIKKCIIREKYDETKEFSLVNKYNAHKEGIKIDVQAETDYLDYLQFTFDLDTILENL